MSKSFWLTNYFASGNLGLESTTKWTKYEFDGFKFSKVLSGDRFVFFVCSETNRLVEFSSSRRDIADNSKVIKLKKKWDVFNSPSLDRAEDQEVTDFTCYYIKDLMGDPRNIRYEMGGSCIFFMEKSRIGLKNYIDSTSTFKIEDYSSYGGVKKFFCGPLSSNYVVLTNDRRVFVNNEEISLLGTNEHPSIIRMAACCGSGVILAGKNTLYARGDNTFNVFTSVQNTLNFERMPFEFPATIKNVKCGYFHTIVLLENNKIYGCGYNTLKQSTFGIDDANIDSLQNFRWIEFDFGIPKEISCSSRGTVVRNESGDVFMVGEAVADFPDSKLKINATIFNFNIHNFDRTDDFNTISTGGWQYIVYHEWSNQLGKDEIYMKANLKELLSSAKLADVTVALD